MAEVAEKLLHGFSTLASTVDAHCDGLRIIEDGGLLDSEDISEDSDASSASSPSEFMDDANTSSSLPSQTASDGPLYELSSLMLSLPIKRGLSKYFEGKSQSFTSLSSVFSIEDLAKREIPMRKRIKSSKRYASWPEGSSSSTLGCRRTITKKPVRCSGSSLPAKTRAHGSLTGGRSSPSKK